MKTIIHGLVFVVILSFPALLVFAEYAPSNNMAANSSQQAYVGKQPAPSTVWDIQHLTELLKDGQEGYKLSADGVQNAELKNLFLQYAEQRARFLNELRAEVARLGGDPDQGGSALGAVHRGWINVKTAISTKDDKAIVQEVLKGEKVALKDYEDALKKELPPQTRRLVEQQRNDIQSAYDRVKGQ